MPRKKFDDKVSVRAEFPIELHRELKAEAEARSMYLMDLFALYVVEGLRRAGRQVS